MNSSPRLSLARRCRAALGAVALAWAWGTVPAATGAVPRTVYVPVYRPLIVVQIRTPQFLKGKPKDRGYLPAVGATALRLLETAAAAPASDKPLVRLYQPAAPEPAPAANTTPTVPAVNPADADASHGAKPAPQPKDFLPFFDRAADLPPADSAEGDRAPFVPARPVLPESRAEFRLK